MRVFDIDDILKLILQFGNFQDFLCFGQVCKRFEKTRCVDLVFVRLISDLTPDYLHWLKSHKWRRAIMQYDHLTAFHLISEHLRVLHLSKLVYCFRVYSYIPRYLIELSIFDCFLPLLSLEDFVCLRKLSLVKCDRIINISFPLQLQHLDLTASDCSDVSKFPCHLQTLNINYCENVRNINALTILTHLKKLSMVGENQISYLQLGQFLVNMKHLQSLDLSGSHVLNNSHLAIIADYAQLQYLNVSYTQKPLDLSIVSHLPNLKEFHINGLVYVTNSVIQHISHLPKLEKLCMSGCLHITSVKSLSKIKTLRYLDIIRCSSITDFAVLPKQVIVIRNLWVPIK
jgi:hypothetical protein